MVVPAFDHENKEKLVEELKTIILKNKEVLNKVQSKLREHGIKLIYQTKGEKTPVDGVSFWSDGNPAIGMTLRHKRLDNFAFTLFHELGHVYEHLVNNNTAEFIDLDIKSEEEEYKNSAEEKEANAFAQKGLINEKEWKEFSKNLEIKNNDESIRAFAKKVKTHPCIVRGRICFTLNDYRSFTGISHDIK
jgi:HTH-type transcriptional regulator/antitoxin HigA